MNEEKNNHKKIYIEDIYISQNCIKQCISTFNEIKACENKDDPILEIVFKNKIINIDILICAYFLLFKQDIKNLEIKICLLENPIHPHDEDQVVRILRQSRLQIFMLSGIEIFTIVKDIENTIYALDTVRKDRKDNLFILSESIIPVLFIDEIKYQELFYETPPHFIPVSNLTPDIIVGTEDPYYQIFRRNLYYNYFLPEIAKTKLNPTSGLLYLTQLAFLNALNKAKILNWSIAKNERKFPGIEFPLKYDFGKNIQISLLQGENAVKYFDKVRIIFDDLIYKPSIYHFIYSALLSSKALIPGLIDNSNSDEVIAKLNNLWNFTKELVEGLRELAKNIVVHSSESRGAITGRVYKGDVFDKLIKNNPNWVNVFEEYKNILYEESKINNMIKKTEINESVGIKEKEIYYFFDINVVDDGQIGIIHNLEKSFMEMEKQNIFTAENKADKDLIENGEITISHFMDPEKELVLNQQAKRATAHLGLLIFSKLIEYNRGLIKAATWCLEYSKWYEKNKNINRNWPKDKEKLDKTFVMPKNIKDKYLDKNKKSDIEMGTNYNIILPFDPNKQLESRSPENYYYAEVISPSEMEDIENLLSANMTREVINIDR
jgi:hypothetical protein